MQSASRIGREVDSGRISPVDPTIMSDKAKKPHIFRNIPIQCKWDSTIVFQTEVLH